MRRSWELLFPDLGLREPGSSHESLFDFDQCTKNRKLDFNLTGEVVSQISVAELPENRLQI